MQRKSLWAISVLLFTALSSPAVSGKAVKKKHAAKPQPVIEQISADEKVLQVLNRLTFGARPGDVDAVKKMGVEEYIRQQLHPTSIPENPALDAKLAPLDTLGLTVTELSEKYPSNQAIRGMALGRRPLPTDPEVLAMIRRPLARYKEKAADAKDPNAPAVSLDQASLKMTPGQRLAFQSGTPEEKVATLAAMPVEEQLDVLEAMGGRRQALMYASSPQLARRVEKLNGPQFVVNQDLFSSKLLRAAYSNRQLQEVLTDFWYNHFNVFIDKGADRYFVTSYERDAIRPYVLGRFHDLLLATAQSPAMLFYLDNAESVGADAMANRNMNANSPNAKKKRGLNENYGRELMELHTLGVDGGYTQQDVTEVARCFTGWTIRGGRERGEFFFNDRLHDRGEKTVLGVKIPAGGGIEDGMKVLDILEHQPATARFISQSLAIRFVSDNPSPALIESMAATFRSTGGDLRAVMETMFQSPDFFAKENYRTKVKTPLELVTSAVRAANAQFQFPLALVQQLNQLGEPLYRKQEPTGYSNKSGDWINSASLLARMNFSLALMNNKVAGVKVDLSGLPAGDPMSAARALLHADLSPEARAVIAEGLADQAGKTPPAALVAGLTLGSPDFQRR